LKDTLQQNIIWFIFETTTCQEKQKKGKTRKIEKGTFNDNYYRKVRLWMTLGRGRSEKKKRTHLNREDKLLIEFYADVPRVYLF